MTAVPRELAEQRALVLAPRGRDAAVIGQVLAEEGLRSIVCESLVELAEGLENGAASAFITEESLDDDALPALVAWLDAQPPWSDLPLVVLATKQAARRSAHAATRLGRLGNVVLLERPLNAETLASAARSAMRSRERQYQLRAHIDEQIRISSENARLYEAEWRALQEAAQAREALSLALSAAELGTFHCPVPFGEIFWNDTCKAHFWLPPDASVNIDVFYSLIHEDDREATARAIASAIDEHKSYDVEYRTVGPDGQYRWLRAKGRAYYGADGQPTRFDGVTIDISRQKSLEAQRESLLEREKAAREEAERVSRVKDEFLATLSHELRTPLNAILGWTHLTRRKAQSPEDLARGLETIERNARAQSKLIDDLLDVSRIIAGKVQLDTSEVVAANVVDAAVTSVQPAADAKSIRLERFVHANAGTITADAHRLQQMLWNLLSNAVKFTPPGGWVRVAVERRSDDLEFCVSDCGVGIEPAFLPYVFDRFRQADASTTRTHGGLGLGLAIVRHLAELHGGTVEALSDGPGTGSVFRVRLPLGATLRGTPDGAITAAELTAPAPLEAPVDLHGLAIVAVDDEADGREFLERLLSGQGARVVAVGSAEQALDAIGDRCPDVLISDIGMPGVDGYELMRRARAIAPRLAAIALTAFARGADRQLALEAGYRMHLAKPVEPAELLAAVARASGRDAEPDAHAGSMERRSGGALTSSR